MIFRLYYIVTICLIGTFMVAQSGVNVRAGVGTMITDESSFTLEDGAHYGWRGAAMARIGASDTWFFEPGLSYERYNINSSSEFNAFDKEPKLHFIKGYVNLSTFLIRNKAFKMRLAGGGTISYLAKIEDNPGYDLNDFNDATLGLNAGLGFDIWFLTIDLGYEQALTDFFHDKEEPFNRFWTLSSGFFF